MSMPKKQKRPEEVIVPENEEQEKQIYACLACKAMYKDAGMCPNCNLVLKKKAE